MVYMKNPRRVFEEYMEGRVSFDRYGYRLGLRAMGLEIVGLIKTLEALPLGDHTPVVISALHTLLQDNEMDIEAYRDYEQLSEWRQPNFVRIDEPDASQPHISPSALRRATPHVSALSYLAGSTAQRRTTRSLPPEHRAHLPSDETDALDPDDVVTPTTPDE